MCPSLNNLHVIFVSFIELVATRPYARYNDDFVAEQHGPPPGRQPPLHRPVHRIDLDRKLTAPAERWRHYHIAINTRNRGIG